MRFLLTLLLLFALPSVPPAAAADGQGLGEPEPLESAAALAAGLAVVEAAPPPAPLAAVPALPTRASSQPFRLGLTVGPHPLPVAPSVSGLRYRPSTAR